MLAIFGKSVATCPDTINGHPDEFANSALKDGSLPGYFSSVNLRSAILNVDSSVVFAHSLKKPDESSRVLVKEVAHVYCMFRGEMKQVDILKKRYGLPDDTDECTVLITIFRILRELRQDAPRLTVLDMMDMFSFVIYDTVSKCVMFASDNSDECPLFCGVDSEHSLVISDDKRVVAKACTTTTIKFPEGEVYISCRGCVGLEAIFMDWTPEEEDNYQLRLSDLDHQIEKKQKTCSPLLPSWQPPSSPDVFKVNTKGLVFIEDNSIGIGVIIRNCRGEIHMALSKKIKGFTRSIYAEELAIIEGLRMAHKGSLKHVFCEYSCLRIGWVYHHGSFYLLLRHVTSALVAGFSSHRYLAISEDANKAANGLAEYAKNIDDCVVWDKETPPCIADVVSVDSESPSADLLDSILSLGLAR